MTDVLDTPIWRYMDLARYISLLDRGLFFANATAFVDSWEGSWGGLDLKLFRERNGHLSLEDIAKQWKALAAAKHATLERFGISCWHLADHESAALWELYVPRGLGVAVTSTPRRVLSSLSGANHSIDPVHVEYSQYDDLEFGLDAIDAKRLLSHKRHEFAHEREIRFLTQFQNDEISAMAAYRAALDNRRLRLVNREPTQPVISGPFGYSTNDPTCEHRTTPNGMHLQTDPTMLIDRVVLAPSLSFVSRRAVLAATSAFSLNRDVVNESTLEVPPFDKLLFVE